MNNTLDQIKSASASMFQSLQRSLDILSDPELCFWNFFNPYSSTNTLVQCLKQFGITDADFDAAFIEQMKQLPILSGCYVMPQDMGPFVNILHKENHLLLFTLDYRGRRYSNELEGYADGHTATIKSMDAALAIHQDKLHQAQAFRSYFVSETQGGNRIPRVGSRKAALKNMMAQQGIGVDQMGRIFHDPGSFIDELDKTILSLSSKITDLQQDRRVSEAKQEQVTENTVLQRIVEDFEEELIAHKYRKIKPEALRKAEAADH